MTQFTYLSFKDVVTIGERGVHDEYAELGNVIDAESARKLTTRLNELHSALGNLLDACEFWEDENDPVLVAARKALRREEDDEST